MHSSARGAAAFTADRILPSAARLSGLSFRKYPATVIAVSGRRSSHDDALPEVARVVELAEEKIRDVGARDPRESTESEALAMLNAARPWSVGQRDRMHERPLHGALAKQCFTGSLIRVQIAQQQLHHDSR